MITGIVVVSYHNAEGTSGYVTEQLARLSDDYRVGETYDARKERPEINIPASILIFRLMFPCMMTA